MSEANSPEKSLIKTSKNPELQKKVEEMERIIDKEVSNLDSVSLNKLARSKVANELKLKKRSDETKKAKETSETDELTKLPNGRWFDRQLNIEIARANRERNTFALIAFDIDSFKAVNDSYGHPVGDKILQSIKLFPAREGEPIARCGEKGDEFRQIIPLKVSEQSYSNYDLIVEQVKTISLRYTKKMKHISGTILKDKLPFANVKFQNAPKEASISIGIVVFSPGMTAQDIIRTADEALYFAKHTGKDRASLATRKVDGSYIIAELLLKPMPVGSKSLI